MLIIIIMSLLPLINVSGQSYGDSVHFWSVGDPEEFGLDVEMLDINEEDFPFLRSLLVVRNGTLIFENYYNDGSQTTAYHIHSASKSFLSALIGLANHSGFLPDLDKKLMDYLSEYTHLDLDPRIYDITIRHLLAMKAGFNFNDTGEEWELYAGSSDWVKYALELDLLHDPGKGWHYGTPQTNLLSVILTKATNRTTMDFANEFLFNPLGITIDHWYQDPQGYYTGGHEMYFTPRELASFGYLYLNNGTINGSQIIPEEWISESLIDYSEGQVAEGMRSSWYKSVGYGYQWWLQELAGYKTFSARGLGGQNIFGVNELNMVIVTTASGNVFNEYPDQYTKMISIVEDYVLPAVKDGKSSSLSLNYLFFLSLILLPLIRLRKKK